MHEPAVPPAHERVTPSRDLRSVPGSFLVLLFCALSVLGSFLFFSSCSDARHPSPSARTSETAAVAEASAPALRTIIDHVPGGYRLRLGADALIDFGAPVLTGCGPADVEIAPVAAPFSSWTRVRMRWRVPSSVKQDELAVRFHWLLKPDFWWAPHLAPEPGNVIAQHVFRSPALITRSGPLTLSIVPDLDLVGRLPGNPWFMDMDAPAAEGRLGLSLTEVSDHVLFRRIPGMTFGAGEVEIAFFVAARRDDGPVGDPWADASRFLWERWARPLVRTGTQPVAAPLENYVRHTYRWAFDSWGKFVWQEFDLGGRAVGAPQFIVNVSQSPNFKGPWYQREFLSIWNQAWFSSLRSASGVFRYARRTSDEALRKKALLTKELALAAPVTDGLFPSVIRTDNLEVAEGSVKVRRPRGWETAYWTNSDRSPVDHGISSDWYHVLDMSWTALHMLRWFRELEPDKRLLDYASVYGERLLKLQDDAGFFPGWLHPATHLPGPVMNRTPETSLSVTFLLELAKATGRDAFSAAALKAMDAVVRDIIPEGRWEDFETYWSCSPWGRDRYLGKKVERNAMHKQNTLSMFWTAEALLACYRATGERRYLDWGRRTLDELAMAQQVWQPPFIYVPALGGFGVMNADGEWNDSRETLFAELFLDYARETGDETYRERGLAALKAGFVMMYCPENAQVKAMWEKVYPWFGPADYGFTMENYGHGGRTSPEGEGVGVFTIYDWGNGAAAEAAMRILDHYPELFRGPSAPAAGKPVIGIEELSRLDLLPKLKQSVKVGSVSSYDRTGGNDDGFSGKYSFIRKEPGGLVLADLEGPGVIYRIHTPSPTDDVIEFYFDGESAPRISRKITELFDGTHAPFLAPLVGAGVGGRYCYLPITFQRSCKVLVKAATFQFYQINYAKFPADLVVPSFEEKPSPAFLEALGAARRLLSRTGSDISPYLVAPGAEAQLRTVTKRITLRPGAAATLFELSRGGRIVGLRLSPAGALAGKARDIVLRIFWDGATEPAVECPAGDFFGGSFGEPAVRSLLLGTAGDKDYCYFPMPFNKAARVELISERKEGPAVDVEAEVTFAPVAKEPDEGRFYALWRRENPTREGEPYTFLKAAGRGHVVGVILQAQGLEPGQTPFFEGDDVAKIDGELAVPGTGSEDSFNGGWYDVPARWENRGSYPLSGCLDYKKPLGRTGGYRWFVTDSYAYRKSIAFTIEHGPEGNKVPTDYTSVVFFYSLEPPAYEAAGTGDGPRGADQSRGGVERSMLPPLEARRVADPEKVVFVPGWNVPVHTTSLENFTLAKRSEKIGEVWARYLAMTTSGEDVFGPHHVSFICDLPAAGRYKVGLKAVLGPDQGIVRIFRNDLPAGDPVDLYAEKRSVGPVLPLGVFDMAAGDNIVFLHLVGKNAKSKAMGFNLIELVFERLERLGSDQVR